MNNPLALMTGIDLPVEACTLVVHQPTIREISFVGEREYFTGIQCLCVNKTMFSQDKTVLSEINNFQIFMTVVSEKENLEKKEAVQKVLSLLFPKYKVLFMPRSLSFVKDGESVVVDEKNFEELQKVVRLICCSKDAPMEQQNFNPVNKRAKEIADKLMQARQRVAAQQQASNKSILAQYLSVVTVGLNIPLDQAINFTLYQMYDIIERYMLYISWDIDIKSRLAGAKGDKPVDNWMKEIH